MSSMLLRILVLPHLIGAATLALALPALAAPGATGSISINGASWPVADAVVIDDDGDLEIVFSQLPFDRSKWADDGEFDSFDLYSFSDDADGASLKVDIDEESGGYGGHRVQFSSSSSSGGYSSDHEESLVLTTRSAERVAGSVSMQSDDLSADVTFDLPVTRTGALARSGTPLPKGGGEPGKALSAMIDATHAGDLNRMTELSEPERRAGIEQARADGEAEQMLKMARLFTPKIERIIGGTVDGDRAWVEFEGKEDGASVKGTGELTRIDGRWYIRSINTRSGG